MTTRPMWTTRTCPACKMQRNVRRLDGRFREHNKPGPAAEHCPGSGTMPADLTDLFERPEVPVETSLIYSQIQAERGRQDAKFPDQHLPDGTGPDLLAALLDTSWSMVAEAAKIVTDDAAREGRLTWRHVAFEEVAEAFAEDNQTKLRAELIQVAAVAVRWIEDIDRRGSS